MLLKQYQLFKFAFFASYNCAKFRCLSDLAICRNLHIVTDFHAVVSRLNKQIIAYSRAGDLDSAHKVFNEMPQRDAVSWNSIMSAYAQHGFHEKVLPVFVDMFNSQCRPTNTSLSIGLSACAELRGLRQGRQIHDLSIKLGSFNNVYVGTSVMTMYAKCTTYDCLVQVFEDICSPNIAAWNALMSGFVMNLQIDDALRVFDTMPYRNVVSWTSMIHGFLEVGKVSSALELFDLMQVKNSVTWSVMIGGLVNNNRYHEAIEFFSRMLSDGIEATTASVVEVLSASSELKSIKQGRKFHGYALKAGFHFHESVEASLVHVYCKCLSMKEAKIEFDKMDRKFIGSCNSFLCGFMNDNKVIEARNFFDHMEEQDHITWSLMINGYLKHNKLDDALELYSNMPVPTQETTTAILSNFIQAGRLQEAQQLLDTMNNKDVIAYTSMLFGYFEHGLLDDARQLFKEMPVRNVVTYNVMISGLMKYRKVDEACSIFNECHQHTTSSWDALITGFVQNELHDEAFLLYKKMSLSGLFPTELVVTSLLSAASKLSLLVYGLQIHSVTVKLGHESNLVVANSLVNMYCRFGDLLFAKLIFDQIVERDVVTWNSMIHGYAFNGSFENAIKMFEDMRMTKIKPDHITFLAVLTACAHNCLVEESKQYFSMMTNDYKITADMTHYSCVVDLLCRVGKVKEAETLIHSMPSQTDPVVWTSLLSACRLNCNIELAELAVKKLILQDSHDPMPLLHLIRIYGSTGKWQNMASLGNRVKKLQSKKRLGCSWI